ncbi:MAG: hypothetical protein HY661_19370 [Betaproteobacteria bacterium]|nr:hypothetical protein [Betaproteobacteria bacterium]
MAKISVPKEAKILRYTGARHIDAYGDGCDEGHGLAAKWLADPRRGRPMAGGTLQHVVLDLAERFKKAEGVDRTRIRGVIVGFCYAIECPEHAAKCQMAAHRRTGKEARHG